MEEASYLPSSLRPLHGPKRYPRLLRIPQHLNQKLQIQNQQVQLIELDSTHLGGSGPRTLARTQEPEARREALAQLVGGDGPSDAHSPQATGHRIDGEQSATNSERRQEKAIVS